MTSGVQCLKIQGKLKTHLEPPHTRRAAALTYRSWCKWGSQTSAGSVLAASFSGLQPATGAWSYKCPQSHRNPAWTFGWLYSPSRLTSHWEKVLCYAVVFWNEVKSKNKFRTMFHTNCWLPTWYLSLQITFEIKKQKQTHKKNPDLHTGNIPTLNKVRKKSLIRLIVFERTLKFGST